MESFADFLTKKLFISFYRDFFMKKEVLTLIFVFAFISLAMPLSAQNNIQDDVPIQIQTTDGSGSIVTGQYEFKIAISNSSTCSPELYNDTRTLDTDNRGIVSYQLENVDLDFDEQYWFCYYRDGTLKETVEAGREPYSFTSKKVPSEGVYPEGPLNLTGITGLFEFLGNVTNRIETLFVKDINATGTVTADSFQYSDGGSVGAGMFVNKTPNRHQGNVGGYEGANSLCDSHYNGSKVCTFRDLKNTIEQKNVSNISAWSGTAWIAGGAPGFTAESNDCSGFTSNSTSGVYGRIWNFDIDSVDTGKGVLNVCSSTNFFACCK